MTFQMRLRRSLAICTLVIAALGFTADAYATHLRGITLSWAPTGVTGQVRFTFIYAQRWTFPNSPGVCGYGACPPLGSTITKPIVFGDGTSGTATGIITSVNQAEDWYIAELTVTHTYTGPGPYNAYFTDCCRLSAIKLGHDQTMRIETIVTPMSGNSSPVSGMPALVTVPIRSTTGFVIVGSDIDRDPLTYRLATSQEMFGVSNIGQPPGLSVNAATGQVTWNTSALVPPTYSAPQAGDLWQVQFVIEDRDSGTNAVKSKVAVDVILKFVAEVGTPPTLTLSPAPPASVQAGTLVSFNITGNDTDANARVTLNVTGLPIGATATNLNQVLLPPVTSAFAWTPTTVGSYVMTFSATDDTLQQTLRTVTIFVEDNKPPTISGPSAIASVYGQPAPISVQVADPNGDALTVEWTMDGAIQHTDTVAASSQPTTVVFDATSVAGTHAVTARVTDPKNASASLDVEVTIAKADQSIAFPLIGEHHFNDVPFAVTATASSGLPVTLSVVSGPATIAAKTITLNRTSGEVTIQASQPGDANYNAASELQSFNVTPDLNITSITFETREWHANTPPVDGIDAMNRYYALPLGRPGYAPAPKTLELFDNVANHVTFNGASGSVAYHHHFAFIAPIAGTLDVRMGADFGYGGTLMLDGNVVDFNPLDMWWNNTWAYRSQYLAFSIPITPGPHTIDSYGFEFCCDGVQKAQYSYLGADFETFEAPPNEVPFVTLSGPVNVAPSTTATYTFSVADPDSGATFALVGVGCGSNGTLQGPATVTSTGGSFQCVFNEPAVASTVSARVKDNFDAESNLATLQVSVNKLTQTIAFPPPDPTVYGAPDFAVSATATSGLPVTITASGVCTIAGGLVHVTGAGSCVLTASQAGNTKYDAAPDVTNTVTVLKADAIVVVAGYTGVYDGHAHKATGTATGLNGEDLTSLLNLGESFTDAPGGTAYWTFAGNTDYNPATGIAAITITKANAAVTVTGYTGVYDGNSHGATGSATGINGVDLTSQLNLGATVTNAPGETAHWTFTGGTNYNNQAGDVAITIDKANAAIAVEGYTGAYDGIAHGAKGTATGVKGETLTSHLNLGATFTNAPGGTAHWTFAGGTNYNDRAGDAAIVLTKVSLTVTAADAAKILGAPLPAFTVSYAGFIPGEGPGHLGGALTFTTSATASSPVGTYSVTPGGLLSPNYDISYVAGTLRIGFNVCVQFDQTKVANSGSTIPIKLQVCDASGINVSAASTVVHATGLVRVSDQVAGTVEDSGQANPDSDFRLVGPPLMYLFNLQTKGLATGTYNLVFTVTGDPGAHSVSFQIK